MKEKIKNIMIKLFYTSIYIIVISLSIAFIIFFIGVGAYLRALLVKSGI